MPSLHDRQTPFAAIDLPALTRNIDRMAAAVRDGGKQLRPHAKTHKSPWIAERQLAAGAVGLCCAKPGEAEAFAAAGVRNIRIAYPVTPTYGARVLALMDTTQLSIIVDDLEVARAWSRAMERAGRRLAVLVKIDVGFHRCGIDPHRQDAPAFVRDVAAMAGLDLRGLLSHPGHAYGGHSSSHIEEIARDEAAVLSQVVDACQAAGVPLDEISVGSTPTARVSAALDRVTEVRPGNYVFHDRTQVGLGVASWGDCALRVWTTVVSASSLDRLILDAGSKVLSSDGARAFGPAPGYGVVLGQGGTPDDALTIERLSEEHATVRVVGATRLRIGDRVQVVPNHACVVANLANAYVLSEGEEVLDELPVVARGRVS